VTLGRRVVPPGQPDVTHRAGTRTAAFAAAGLYLAAAVGFTWPLAAGLARDVPWDMGDPLLNCWILAWDADHLLRFLHANLDALRGFWNANIFYPEPLTLAYSEHLFAQALQILPVYAATRNVILCYNLLLISTFALSGLGMFLLVRELTGSPRAAFVAGMIYAFAPLRVSQLSHLQVLSSQWMPFALFGLRRYFESRRLRPLAGAVLALTAQNLSCGYFLLYFSPFVLAYTLVEIADRRLWRNRAVWIHLGTAAVTVFLATLPFLVPYLALRNLGFGPRPISEVAGFSADVYGYLTASSAIRLIGRVVRAFPKPEGELFPSVTAIVLAGLCLLAWLRNQWAASRLAPSPAVPSRRWVAAAACGVFAAYLALSAIVLAGYGFSSLGPIPIRAKDLWRNLEVAAAALAVLLIVSPRTRVFFRGTPRSLAGFCLAAAGTAFLLSLGPSARAMGSLIGAPGPYTLLYWHVPGFDGLRVPARYSMVVMLFGAAAAGYGAVVVERAWRRGGALVIAAAVFMLVEANAAPLPMNAGEDDPDYVAPSGPLLTGANVPAVYRYARALPPDAVLAEFPFGSWPHEIRYVYYSTEHWRRLINGYSGVFPLSYGLRARVLRDVRSDPDSAWQALVGSGTTVAIVHEGAYKGSAGAATSAWLVSHGARPIASFDTDRVFAVQPGRGAATP
jgi:hypothetical protein